MKWVNGEKKREGGERKEGREVVAGPLALESGPARLREEGSREM